MSDIQEEQRNHKREYAGVNVVVNKELYDEYKGTLQEQIEELQEENIQLKKLCDKYEEEHSTKFNEWVFDKRENQRLKEALDKVVQENTELENRINKAIEYINEAIVDTDITEVINTDELLNILQGDNK